MHIRRIICKNTLQSHYLFYFYHLNLVFLYIVSKKIMPLVFFLFLNCFPRKRKVFSAKAFF